MSVNVAVREISITTGAAGSTVSITGLPFQPSFMQLIWSGRTESGNAGGSANGNRGWGYALDPSVYPSSAFDYFCTSYFDQDGVGAQATAQSVRTDACIVDAGDGVTNGYADVQSWNSDGVTFEILDAFVTDLRVTVLLIGGLDNAEIILHSFTSGPSNPFTIDIDNVGGFQPSVAFFHSLDAAPGNIPWATGNVRGSYGVAVGAAAADQWAYADRAQDGASTGATNRYLRTGECHVVYSNTNTANPRAQLQSMNADGLTLNYVAFPSPSANSQLCCVQLKGGDWNAGSFLTQTDTTTPMSVSGLSSQPKGLIFVAHGLAENGAGVSATHCHSSIAFADSASNRFTQQYSSRQGNTNMFVQTFHRSDKILVLVDPTTDAVYAEADLTAINSDGFAAIMTDADTSQKLVVWLSVGNAGVTGTLSVTLDAATVTGTGKVQVKGTSSVTLDAATLVGTGISTIEGAANITTADATLAATGKVQVKAALAVTLDDATLVATGTSANDVEGALNVTLDDATLSAQGVVQVKGQLSVTLEAATVTGTGKVRVSGQLSTTLDDATAVGVGVVPVEAALGSTLDNATLIATGKVVVKGQLSTTLDAATLSASGDVIVKGVLNTTLDDAILVATGASVSGIIGTLNVTLDAATLVASGISNIKGAADITLEAATVVATGVSSIRGAANITLADATVQADGDVRVKGNLNVTLDDAVVAGSGIVGIIIPMFSADLVSESREGVISEARRLGTLAAEAARTARLVN